MQAYRLATAGLGAAAIALSSWVFLEAGQLPPGASAPAVAVPPQATRLPLAPTSGRGTTVTPAFEGWYRNEDGTATFLVGYMNRNTKQAVEIPVGPNNHIDPGGPDYGQPTFFEIGRQYGVFAVTVPKDFGTKRLTWTLVANGQQQAITLWTNQPYSISPFVRADNGNSPPVVKFAPTGPEFTGPPRGFAQTMTTTVAEPVTLAFWTTDKGNTVDQMNQFGPPVSVASPVDDPSSPANAGLVDPAAAADAPAGGAGAGGRGAGRGGGGRGAGGAGAAAAGGAGGRGGGAGAAGGGGGRGGRGGASIRVRWVKHRGPGDVTFANATPPVVAEAMTFSKPGDFTGKATTTAKFSAPGEYVLRGQLNDSSGQGGDGCCWTNVHVKVTVRP